ncbi:hypothetical protein JMUB7557_27760 [Staphylococcus aureus]
MIPITANALNPSNPGKYRGCLLYTSDAADDGESVDLGGRRIIKKNNAVSYTHLTLPTTERV